MKEEEVFLRKREKPQGKCQCHILLRARNKERKKISIKNKAPP